MTSEHGPTNDDLALELIDHIELFARRGELNAMVEAIADLAALKLPYDAVGYVRETAIQGCEDAIPMLVEHAEHLAVLGEAHEMAHNLALVVRVSQSLGRDPPARFPFAAQGYALSAMQWVEKAREEAESGFASWMEESIQIALEHAERGGIEIRDEQLAFRRKGYERGYERSLQEMLELPYDTDDPLFRANARELDGFGSQIGAQPDPRVAVLGLNVSSHSAGRYYGLMRAPEHDLSFLISCAADEGGYDRFLSSLDKDARTRWNLDGVNTMLRGIDQQNAAWIERLITAATIK